MSTGASYHGLILIRGIGAQVKNTVTSRKDFLPQTSDKAPIRGALRKDSNPYTHTKMHQARDLYGKAFDTTQCRCERATLPVLKLLT